LSFNLTLPINFVYKFCNLFFIRTTHSIYFMVFDVIIFIIFAEWNKLWTLGYVKLLVFQSETVEINNTIIAHSVKMLFVYLQRIIKAS